MLTRETLQSVTTIVCHENSPHSPCPDGTASAIILKDALPRATILFVSHGRALEQLPTRPGMLFCDIAPTGHPDTIKGYIDAGAIVIDHHDKQKDIVERFGDRGVYASGPCISGAMLAFSHVWSVLKADASPPERQACHDFALLASIRDSWQREHPLWTKACEQAEALRFWPFELFPVAPFFGNEDVLEDQMRLGPVLWKRRNEIAEKRAAEVFTWTTDKGTRVAILGSTEISDVADLVDADVLVGFRYFTTPENTRKMILSFRRARSDYDVGAIAVSIGGGGHREAAGATMDDPGCSPFGHIFSVMSTFEESR